VSRASVEIVGATRCAATLNVAAARLGRLDDAARTSSNVIATTARLRAPKRTGRLAAAVAPSPQGSDARVRVPVRYGWPVHSGVPSLGQPARPFLSTAAAATEPVWVGAYARNVEHVMSQVKGA